MPFHLGARMCCLQGWLSHSLTTSSLLQAVGLSAGPVGTAGLTAAFKWIAKDGIGAFGRLLVGGRLGLELDDDPRRCGGRICVHKGETPRYLLLCLWRLMVWRLMVWRSAHARPGAWGAHVHACIGLVHRPPCTRALPHSDGA